MNKPKLNWTKQPHLFPLAVYSVRLVCQHGVSYHLEATGDGTWRIMLEWCGEYAARGMHLFSGHGCPDSLTAQLTAEDVLRVHLRTSLEALS